MLKKASTTTLLVAALAICSPGTGCSGDDSTPIGGSAGTGGTGPSSSTTSTVGSTVTTVGTGGRGGGGTGGVGVDGSGGAGGGGTGGTGGTSGGDASVDSGSTDAATGSDAPASETGDAGDGASGGPQAETAVILIDEVMVTQKPVVDAGADGGVDAGTEGGVDAGTDGGVDAGTEGGPLGASYTFDADIQGWHYTPYGSSPNIGFPDPGGVERPKLSDVSQSQLVFDSTNDANGRIDASGALKLTVGFLAANDQIDAQAFSVFPNDATQWKVWRGFVATAKIKLVSGGNLNPLCPMKAWLYVTAGAGYATGVSPTVNLTRGITDWVTVTFDLDAPLGGTPDPTQVNQLGIQISTSTCP